MASEPMITIKDADGTMKQVPLSQLSHQSAPASASTVPAMPKPSTNEDVEKVMTTTDDIAKLAARAAEQVAAEARMQADMSDIDMPPASLPVVDPIVFAKPRTSAPRKKVTPTIPFAQKDTGVVSASSDMSAIATDTMIVQDLPEAPKVPTAKSTPVTPPPASAPIVDDLMVIPKAGALATTVPNTHVFEAHKDWDDTDHGSLLDEALTEADTTVPHSTSRPGMAAALRAKEAPVAAPPQMTQSTSDKPTPKKPNTEQFNAAFSAIAPRSDMPYTPGLKKVPMQDIVAASPAQSTMKPVGPAAELGAMTLDDFRRLGGRGEVGIAELRHKFELLLKESIVTYMQGVAAWHQSPLYRTYLGMIEASVAGRTTMEEVFAMQASDTAAMTAAEWQALAGLHADIRL